VLTNITAYITTIAVKIIAAKRYPEQAAPRGRPDATKRPLEDRSRRLDDTASVSAILDRFLERIHLVKITK
jgi:hypothetical protein